MSPLSPLFLALMAPAAQDHSPLHPGDASLFLQAPDIPALVSAYQQSAYAQLLGDTELQAAIGRVMGQETFDPMAMGMAELEAAEKRGDVPAVRHLLAALRGVSLSVNMKDNDLMGFVQGMESAANEDDQFAQTMGIQAVVDMASADAASELIELIFSTMSPREQDSVNESTVEGPKGSMKAWTIDDPSPMAQSIGLYQDGGRLILCMGDLDKGTRMQRLGSTGVSMAERLGAQGKALGAGKGTALFHLHNRMGDQILDLLEAELDMRGSSSMLLQLAEALAGPGYSMIMRTGSWRISAEAGNFVTQGVHVARKTSVLDEAIGATNLSPESLTLIHPDAIAAGIIALDADKISAWTERLMAEEDAPDMADIQAAYGFHPIEDLIRPMGSAISWSLGGNISIGAPPFQMGAAIRDPEAFRTGLSGLMRMLGQEAGEAMTVKSKPYRGYDVMTLKFNGDGLDLGDLPVNPVDMIQPTFVVLDDRVLMTLNSIQAKREIKRVLKGDGELNPALSGDLIPTGGAGEIGFANWIEVLGSVYGAAKSMAPMMASGLDPNMGVDLTQLPSPDLLTRHFDMSHEWKRRSGDMVHYYGSSSFGPEWNGLAVMSVFGLVGATSVGSPEPRVIAAELVQEADPEGTALSQIRSLQQAVDQFQGNNGGRLPASLDLLFALDSNGTSYAPAAMAEDPWGQKYLFWSSDDGTQFAIWSAGPNGIDDSGEGDDVIADS